MKKLFLLLFLGYAFILKAQPYTFSKSMGTYSNLTGTTIIENSNWSIFEKSVKMPFPFVYWGVTLSDSFYIDDYGSISIDDNYFGEISFLYEDLKSRGAARSVVSYKTEGTAPNRIFKLEYRNVGFEVDARLADSANVQCWIYETTNVIEFRYGPNGVKPTTWADTGPYVDLVDVSSLNTVSIEGNPADPTVKYIKLASTGPLDSMPENGMIYKFTPFVASGINDRSIKINAIQNKIVLPASIEVRSINIYNMNGQVVQSASTLEGINLSELPSGLYVISVETKDGIITQKLIQ